MTAWPGAGRDDHCYRHPDRLSFALCQRCGRTICGECQTPAAVGVICPECLRDERARSPRATTRARGVRPRGAGASATTWVLGVTAAVSAVQLVLALVLGRDVVADALQFSGLYLQVPRGRVEPWRLLSYSLVHGSIIHLAFNLVALWFFGRAIESALGWRRFLALYLASVVGGAVAVALLAPYTAVIGASGGIFGLMAAAVFVVRRTGESPRTLLVLIAINLLFGFVGSGVSWQAHVGGLLVGLLCGWLLLREADHAPGRRLGSGEVITWSLAVVLAIAPIALSLLGGELVAFQ